MPGTASGRAFRRTPTGSNQPLTDEALRAAPVEVIVDGSVSVDNPVGVFWSKALTFVPVAQGGAGTTVLAAAQVGKRHKLMGAVLLGAAGATLKFTDDGGDLSGVMAIGAVPFILPPGVMPYLQTGATNRALNLVTATATVQGFVIVLTEAGAS